jgi:uncharacterized damage-inducible protein DinB
MSNPYAACLGTRDARAVLASTPGLLQQALATLSPERIAAPIALGKWSPREIVAHLADCELAHSFRLRQILAAPASEPALLQPFDQDAWAKHYSAYGLAEALELFRANRLWNLKLVGTLSEADFDRPAHHPDRGNLTLRIQLETMAGHDLNHLVQLQRLSVTQA